MPERLQSDQIAPVRDSNGTRRESMIRNRAAYQLISRRKDSILVPVSGNRATRGCFDSRQRASRFDFRFIASFWQRVKITNKPSMLPQMDNMAAGISHVAGLNACRAATEVFRVHNHRRFAYTAHRGSIRG